MTTEEFYGHLQALLTGPMGGEAASLILHKALAHNPAVVGGALGEAIAHATKDIMSDVLNMMLYTHLSAMTQHDDKGKPLSLQTRFATVKYRLIILDKIRASLRQAMHKGGESGRAAAAAVYLTLD